MWEFAKAERLGGRKEQQERVEIISDDDRGQHLLVVADGLSGHEDGSLASATIVETARTLWKGHVAKPRHPEKLLGSICAEAHRKVNQIGAERGGAPRGACVMLFLDGQNAHWANVGVSRLYRCRGKRLELRSRDHAVPQMPVDMGSIDVEEMAGRRDANRLTESVGGRREPKAHFGSAELAKNDGFLLCTDGLWATLSLDDMAAAFKTANLELAAQELASIAADRGGRSGGNVAVALARFDPIYVQEEELSGKAIDALNGLIAVCNDGCEAFEAAADKVDDPRLLSLFLQMRDARARVREELRDEVHKLGGNSQAGGTLSGSAMLLFSNFVASLLNQDELAILKELEIAEDRVKGKFLDALKGRLPVSIQEAIKRQLDSILDSHDLISAMKRASE